MKRDIEDSLKFLRLQRKNNCVLMDASPDFIGMIRKIENYVTWGEIDKETLSMLLKKRGRIFGNKRLTEDYVKKNYGKSFDEFVPEFYNGKVGLESVPGVKKLFRLRPPSGGFERGGIKKPFSLGGTLGYRGKFINELIRRMI